MIDAIIAEDEVLELSSAAEFGIRAIIYSADRLSKHDPYTWKDESEAEHIIKAARHIMTHTLIIDGYQPDDGEDHLHNAVCRLAMALARRRT